MSDLKIYNPSTSSYDYAADGGITPAQMVDQVLFTGSTTGVGNESLGVSGYVGISSRYAREDHIHILPSTITTTTWSSTLSNYSEIVYNIPNGSSTSTCNLNLGSIQYLLGNAAYYTTTLYIPSPGSQGNTTKFTLIINTKPNVNTLYTMITTPSTGELYWMNPYNSPAYQPPVTMNAINIYSFFTDGTQWYGWKIGAA